MYHIGNKSVLDDDPIAIYCSRNVPTPVHDSAFSLMSLLMSTPVTLAGGWQSKLEKASLRARKPGAASNIIYFLTKGIHNFRLPESLRGDLDNGKVLIVSLWMRDSRIDQKKVKKRDDFIIDRIQRFLFLNIQQGGNLEELFFGCLELGKEVFLLDRPENRTWLNPQIVPLSENDLTPLFP